MLSHHANAHKYRAHTQMIVNWTVEEFIIQYLGKHPVTPVNKAAERG
jgi:hypothetical protein